MTGAVQLVLEKRKSGALASPGRQTVLLADGLYFLSLRSVICPSGYTYGAPTGRRVSVLGQLDT